jgi:hypothetical protein
MYCIVQTYALAGLGSGITEGILTNPFEVVKVFLKLPFGKAMILLKDYTHCIFEKDSNERFLCV